MDKKRRLIIGILLLCIGQSYFYCMEPATVTQTELPMKKKKILILTSLEGGNLVASKAMQSYLESDYDIQISQAFEEILAPIDPLSIFNSSGEQFYCSFVPGKHFELLAWIYKCGTWYMQSQKDTVHGLLKTYFIKTQPDLIISVVPVINNMVLSAAEELAIPFLLAPTDLDITPYIMGIKNPTYGKFYLNLIFDDAQMAQIVQNAGIPQKSLHITGAPLRKDFLIPKDKFEIRKKYNLKQDIPIIMVLMGSFGSNEIKDYATQLMTIQKPCHLLICIGKNEESRKDLAQLQIPAHITTSIIGFTHDIADYMAASDLLITKSGTLSVCEALYMDLPLFLDATSTLLPWEKFNHTFIKQHSFGMSITQFSDVGPLIANALEHEDELILYKKNIEKLEKKNCSVEFKKLVDEILK
jgi:processive 1,2-diacylglycerol beta-glucosyltransferase